MNFREYYFTEATPLSVIPTVGWNMFTNMFRDTKKIPVAANWLSEIHPLTKKTYQRLVRTFAGMMNYNRKVGKKQISVDNIFRGYLTDMRINALKTKLGDFNLKEKPKPNIPVYKFSNGSTVVFFDLPSEESGRIYGVGFDRKASQTIEKILGMTFKDFINITTDMKQPGFRKSDIDDVEPLSTKPTQRMGDYVAVTYKDDEPTQKSKESLYGFVDVKYSDYLNLIDIWGDGKTGGVAQGMKYPFKGYFKRTKIENNIGSGYKYSNGKYSVYLLDLKGDDDSYALIAFDGKRSYDWAKRIGLLNVWGGKHSNIDWKYADIENLPEGIDYEF